MRNTTRSVIVTVAVIATALAGCGKKEPDVSKDMQTAARDTGDAIKDAAESIKKTSEQVAQDVKAASEKLAQDVTAKTQELAAPVNQKAQEIINETKALVNEGKVQAALTKWQELASQKLSAEQKALSEKLKTQIDKLLATSNQAATNTSKAVGNLIK